MQPEPMAVAITEPEARSDRSMLILQYPIGGLAAAAAVLLAFLH